jgi:hypothetical protein
VGITPGVRLRSLVGLAVGSFRGDDVGSTGDSVGSTFTGERVGSRGEFVGTTFTGEAVCWIGARVGEPVGSAPGFEGVGVRVDGPPHRQGRLLSFILL